MLAIAINILIKSGKDMLRELFGISFPSFPSFPIHPISSAQANISVRDFPSNPIHHIPLGFADVTLRESMEMPRNVRSAEEPRIRLHPDSTETNNSINLNPNDLPGIVIDEATSE